MPACSAWGCKNRREEGFKLYRFPADKNRRRVWVLKTRRKNWSATDHSRLCQEHFEEDCFRKTDRGKKLKTTAMPTIFSFFQPRAKGRPLKQSFDFNVHLDHNYSKRLRHVDAGVAFFDSVDGSNASLDTPMQRFKNPVVSQDVETCTKFCEFKSACLQQRLTILENSNLWLTKKLQQSNYQRRKLTSSLRSAKVKLGEQEKNLSSLRDYVGTMELTVDSRIKAARFQSQAEFKT